MNNRKMLLTTAQFMTLARPTSIHLDDADVSAYIRECEDAYIIPAVGYPVFKAAVESEGSTWDRMFDGTFSALVMLDGGEWIDSDGEVRYLNGLRKALAYYVHARMGRADGAILSRTGQMRHRDDYADHVREDKGSQYNDVMDMADAYLSEVVHYMHSHLKSRHMDDTRTASARGRIIAIGE